MSYGLRIRLEYKDINNVLTRINIYQKDYSGSADVRYANAGIQAVWGDADSDMLPLVYGSECTLFFDAETDYEFLYLFSEDARKHKIEIEKNGAIFWKGFAEPGTWSEPLIAPPYPVRLTGYDGLGLLKDEDFLDENKNYYTGYYTPLAILQLILAKTGLDLPYNTAISLRPLGLSKLADPLGQVIKDVVSYQDMNCYEILEMLFGGCRIFQRGGEWYVVSNDKWNSASFTCYSYLANGTANGTKTITTELTGFWMENQANMRLMPALKQLTITQDYGLKANLIANNNFDEYENGNFDGWTAVGLTPEQKVFDADGNKFVYLPGVEYKAAWTDSRSKYLVSAAYPVTATSNIPKIAVDYALISQPGKSANIFIGVKLVTATSAYSLAANMLTDRKTIEYVWVEQLAVMPLGCPAQVTHKKVFLGADSYYVDKVPVPGYIFAEVTDNFKTHTITVPAGIPADGDVFIYLYLPNSGDSMSVYGSCFRNLKLVFTDENENELPTSQEIVLINNAANNFTPDDIALTHGDLPDITNKKASYNGGFLLNSGANTPTLLWQLDAGGVVVDYAELTARLIAAQMANYRQAYQVRLADIIPATSLVFTDTNNSDVKLIEAGITYDDRMQATEGRYIEVVAHNGDNFTVIKKTITEKPTGKAQTKSAATIATPPPVTVTVGMITPLFEVVNQPGYLSTEDFEQTIDEVSGRASIGLRPGLMPQRKYRVTPTGIVNGSNLIFYIADTVIEGTEEIFKNGILLTAGVDYTITYAAITTILFSVAPTNVNYADIILVNYSNGETLAVSNQNFELELALKSTGGSYMEYTETAGLITRVDYWQDPSKLIKLFTKTITYTGSNPVQIITTDEVTGKILQTVPVYTGDVVTSVIKTIT